MIQGTTSDAGKSTIALGIYRLLKRAGKKVAPFKPQNMSLNSAVTTEGGEIGRAQALQAIACGIEPHSDMNPVLLKPNSNSSAQVIIQGKVWKDFDAQQYHASKQGIMPIVMDSFDRLRSIYDYVVVEGAGSPAEINLRDNDIANMGFAQAANVPVLLIADIDRGGVFAHLYGTYYALDLHEQYLIKGLLINKFRGDLTLLEPGIKWLERKTTTPVLGVMPYLSQLVLDAEDSLSQRRGQSSDTRSERCVQIVVPQTPRISNHTDFEPLLADARAKLIYCHDPPVQGCDLVILPGSKSVMSDLGWMRAHCWEDFIRRHLRYGGRLIGICGGFQMLGDSILDPYKMESDCREYRGMHLLQMKTEMTPVKKLARVSGRFTKLDNASVTGYEIHMGESSGLALASPLAMLDDCRSEGAISADGQILGTYMHGLFDQAEARNAILKWCGSGSEETVDFGQLREDSIDAVADAIMAHTDWKRICAFFDS